MYNFVVSSTSGDNLESKFKQTGLRKLSYKHYRILK